MDPLVDTSSISLYYVSEGGDTHWLVQHLWKMITLPQGTAVNALNYYLSPVLDRGVNHCLIEVYDISTHLDGSPHGGPVDAGNWTLPTAGPGTGYVEGVAVAFSYQAEYGSDVEFAPGARPRSRDRNRHYLGPLSSTAITAGTVSSRALVSTGFISDALANLAGAYYVNSSGISRTLSVGDWQLSQWSRKNALMKPVVELWVDDRPDYQRRRSDAPGRKTSLLVP